MARNKIINRGKDHPSWVGDNFKSLSWIHDWVRGKKPKPEKCEHCKKVKPIDLSLKNGHKYSRDPKDYEWLCRRCHMIYDGRIKPSKNICEVCKKKTNNKRFCSSKCREDFPLMRKGKNKTFFCYSCKQFMKKELFPAAKDKVFGIGTQCRECVSKKYYFAKK